MPDVLLEVTGLKKYFHVAHKAILKAVDDVSFKIERGKTLGLVGESGCGKTTVGRTIMRIYEPDGGSIIYDGKDISKLTKAERKQLTAKMQMIFQDPYASLNPFFTVEGIIGEGLDIHGLCATKAERRERILELLDMVNLNAEQLNRFPHEFSGGQRQRVGIARALALNPEFIVCDEAISALDVSIQAQIMNMLIDLQTRLGLTYLFIAHDLSMVRHISDQLAVMYVGTLVEFGDTDEVYEHPLHPYTQGLMSAVPVADPKYERSHKRIILEGETTSPVNPGPGCRFCSRCPKAGKRCKDEMPELRDMGSGHMVACHNV